MLKTLYHEILYRLPKKIAHKIIYFRVFHKKLNLTAPQDLNEKIHYLIIHKYGEKEAQLSDKIAVKEILAKKKIPHLNIIKTIKTYDDATKIDFEELGTQFVLKCNHGSGDVIVCKDKKNLDIEKVRRKIEKSLKKNYAKASLEYHYALITPQILCEEYLDSSSASLNDYKFFCYSGKVECILVCSDREHGNYRDYFDLNWNHLNYSYKKYQNPNPIEKPKNLSQMIEIASQLSNDFPFVRVDLYNIDGKIYFGELTFSPNAGLCQNVRQEYLNYLGSLISIE